MRGGDMYKHFFKRVFDIIFSLMALIVLWFPMLIIAIVVKSTSKGPAIFVQERMGRKGKPFKFYKFRSMRIDAPHDLATRAIHSEEYITKVGAFLRKTSLDELPQLFCILKGDMSLIGPRPVVLVETDLIEKRVETGADLVRPGLTGLAQVKKRDRLTDMTLKAEIDGEYAKNVTFFNDLKIFFQTFLVVFSDDNFVEGTAVMEEEPSEKNAEEKQGALEALEEVASADNEQENDVVS